MPWPPSCTACVAAPVRPAGRAALPPGAGGGRGAHQGRRDQGTCPGRAGHRRRQPGATHAGAQGGQQGVHLRSARAARAAQLACGWRARARLLCLCCLTARRSRYFQRLASPVGGQGLPRAVPPAPPNRRALGWPATRQAALVSAATFSLGAGIPLVGAALVADWKVRVPERQGWCVVGGDGMLVGDACCGPLAQGTQRLMPRHLTLASTVKPPRHQHSCCRAPVQRCDQCSAVSFCVPAAQARTAVTVACTTGACAACMCKLTAWDCRRLNAACTWVIMHHCLWFIAGMKRAARQAELCSAARPGAPEWNAAPQTPAATGVARPQPCPQWDWARLAGLPRGWGERTSCGRRLACSWAAGWQWVRPLARFTAEAGPLSRKQGHSALSDEQHSAQTCVQVMGYCCRVGKCPGRRQSGERLQCHLKRASRRAMPPPCSLA